ncbi:MAG: type VII toxin-antitoxin system HepT family RNase toxin [Candidatus Helarchaeota archaeon]
MRIDIIKMKLKIIEDNISIVKDNLPSNLDDFLNLGLIKDGIYKKIEHSIQEVLSICSILNSDLRLGIPSDRDEMINILIEKEVISQKMGKKIKEMKGFGNFLVHRYGKIDDNIAYKEIKNGISDFNDFKKEILQFLANLNK